MRFVKLGVAAAMALLFLAACTHAIELRELDQYKASSHAPLTHPLTIGLALDSDDDASRQLTKDISASLRGSSALIVYPYTPGSGPVDVITRVKVKAQGQGSGWNFPITFPGFLVWAPAWHGYDYEVDYDIGLALSRGDTNARIDAWSVPVHFDVRHASLGRTWAEIGWVSYAGMAVALVDGFVFTRYNSDITRLAMEKAGDTLGENLAQQIVARVNNSGIIAPPMAPITPHSAAAQPPAASPAPAPPAPVQGPPVAAPAPTAPAVAPAPVQAPAPAAPSASPPRAAAGGPVGKALSGASLRERPVAGAPAQPIPAGTEMQLVSQMKNGSGIWWYVRLNGHTGWILASELQTVP